MDERRRGRPLLRWILPAALLIAWLVVGGLGGPILGQLSDVQKNDNAAFLPESAESTEVAELQKAFVSTPYTPAIVVAERSGGLTEADQDALQRLPAEIESAVDPVQPVSPPLPADDGEAAQLFVALPGTDGEKVVAQIADLRQLLDDQLPDGLRVHVTGPAAIGADFGASFEGIDGLLLGVTAAVVALILVVVYRSPLLPLIVLAGSAFALSLAALVVYALADADVLDLNGQSQGILFILVFGASTDYALLLVARFREELGRTPDTLSAIRAALRTSFGPILASGATVIAGVLCLLFSDLTSNQGLGPVAAIGIAASLLVSLAFLPAALTLLGRSAFWPVRPKYAEAGSEAGETSVEAGRRTLWARIADGVGRRPRLIWVATTVVLLVGVAFLPQLKASGTAQSDVFLTDVDSVLGQDMLSRHFVGGTGAPALVIANADAADQVLDVVAGHPGVADATLTTDSGTGPGAPAGSPPGIPPGSPPASAPPLAVDGRVQITATLDDAADSEAAIAVVRDLRADLDEVPGADAKVGGPTALQLDTQDTSIRDRSVIIPIVIGVILLILGALLRAIVAPVLLVLTVVLSFAASLGVAALVFNHILDFPGADPSVPLFGFVFLVALGVDYNIFLMTRTREETPAVGARRGVLRALAVTGGVITSAGVVLAATFSALAVIPLLFLAQIAFIVAFGVLLDTFVVRSLLVPALVADVGRPVWWPGRLSRRPEPEAGCDTGDTGDTAGAEDAAGHDTVAAEHPRRGM